MSFSSCRSCGKPIIWAKTESGKNIPLDPDIDPHGSVLLLGDGKTAHVLKKDEDGNYSNLVSRHHSHFYTCPNADAHRRKKP